jgi:hypothetical protein
MSAIFKQYLRELEVELNQLESSAINEKADIKKQLLKNRIKKLKALIGSKGNKYLVCKKEGYLSSQNSLTTNREFAYVFDEKEAIDKARSIKGWIEEY